MLTFAVAAFAIVFTTVVNGAPSSSKSRGLLPSVKYCVCLPQLSVSPKENTYELRGFVQKNKNYGGACLETGVVSGSCQNVADGFDNTVTSLLMDSGLTCTIYWYAGAVRRRL